MIRTILALTLCAVSAWAQAVDPSALGRAGAHDLRQKNASALSWNPAVLGPHRGYRMSFELPSAGGGFGNNAFSVDYWNSHLAGDRTFTDADKAAILSEIPASGLESNAHASVPILGFNYNRFGIRTSVESHTTLALPKDLAELALYGNELNHRYGLGKFELRSQTYSDIAAGFAYQFDQEQIADLYFGIGFHYYQGLYLAEVAESEGDIMATDSLITGSSLIHTVRANSGDGVGFDLGGLAVLNDHWEVGLSLQQIGSSVAWNVDDNNVVAFYTDSAGVVPDSLRDNDYLERAFHYTDTTYGGGSYETKLPLIVQANTTYRISRKTVLFADFSIRTKKSASGPSGAQLSLAGEYMALPVLPLSAGFSFGGALGWQIGIGGGLRFRNYEMDLGWTWNDGLFNSTRGFGVAFAQRLKF